MDLNYTDAGYVPQGIITDGELDMAFGSDENNFELSVDINDPCCVVQGLIYMEDTGQDGKVMHTEYGGIIDGMRVDTEENVVIFCGRTWHGIMEGKILSPDSGEDYLILSGEANAVLQGAIDRMDLGNLFMASEEDSGIVIDSYQMDRYVGGYTGIRKMLSSAGAKLQIRYSSGKVILAAVPAIDYSQDEEWDSNQMNFVIENNVRPTNHLVCLGKGDLKDRVVLHLYADADGNISRKQTFFGINEVAGTYDYSSVESEEELEKNGREQLQKLLDAAQSLETSFDNSMAYDIDDIVGAKEIVTGTQVRCRITKKIVKVNKNGLSIECQIGE